VSAPSNLGDLLARAGALRSAARYAEAEAAYKRVLSLAPTHATSWYNLAWTQRWLGRFHEALASYQRAIDCGVSGPEEAHLNRAVIYTDALRQDDAAERELEAALRRNGRYVPALLNYGNLCEDRGDAAGALKHYERALDIDPGCTTALARRAVLTRVADADDPIIARLEAAITARAMDAPAQAELGFALGKVLDDAGAYARAFATYVEANRAARRSAGPQAPAYDRAAHERLIDAVIAAFAHASQLRPAPAGRAPPVFICGMFRSGSTLAEQVLAAHPRVTAGGELPYLPAMAERLLAPFPAGAARAGDAQVAAFAADYLQRITTLFPRADVVTDKRPDNYLYIGLIKRLFPDAKIVHTRRNPLDNALSIYFLHLDPSMRYASDLGDIGHQYLHYERLMSHWRKLYPADILDFDYDAFVRTPRTKTEELLAFCGLDWDERCLAFHAVRNSVKTASVWQVREPLYQRASGRWRNYAAELAPLRAALGLEGG
jgi:tetratricopeptide (TPR) repeat protein